MAKGKRLPIPKTTMSRFTRPLERVFVDLAGPKPIPSAGGANYIMLLKDDYTRYGWIALLKQKSDVTVAFQRWLANIRADGVPSTVECVRSDHGGEFTSKEFMAVCDQHSFRREFTTASTP